MDAPTPPSTSREPIAASPSRNGPVWRAGLAYAVILALLFQRLFDGDVLRPGAEINDWVPFSLSGEHKITPHLSDVHQDVWRVFAPYQWYQYRSAQEGRFPTWNPHSYLGSPFHAQIQSSMLCPFNWVYFAFDPELARGPVTCLRLWISAVALFSLSRRWGLSSWGSFVGGVVWILGSFHTRWLLFPLASVTLWFPVVLLALDRLLEKSTVGRACVAGLAVAVLQLSGHPELQYLCGLVAGVVVLFRASSFTPSWTGWLVKWSWALLAMILGTLAAAASLVPFVLLMLESHDWQSKVHRIAEPLPWSTLLLLVAPDALGRPRARFEYIGPLNYNELAFWFGLLPLVWTCAAIPLAMRWKASNANFASRLGAGLVLVCLAVVFRIWPIDTLVGQIPLVDQCNQYRLLVMMQLGGSLLAGYGFETLVRGEVRWFRPVSLLGMIALSGLFAVLIAASPAGYRADEYMHLSWIHDPVLRYHAGFAIGIGTILLLLTLMLVRGLSRPAGLGWRTLLAFAVTFDLFWTAWEFNPVAPRFLADPSAPPLLKQVMADAGHQRIIGTSDILSPNLALRFGFLDVRGYDYPLSARLVAVLERLGLPTHITMIPVESIVPAVAPMMSGFLNRCAVAWIFTNQRRPHLAAPREGDSINDWPLVRTTEGGAAVYRNPNAYARAWLARSATVGAPDAALDHLLEPAADLRQASIVESSDPLTIPQDAEGTVELIVDRPEEVVLNVESPTGGLVVLVDRMEEGWQVLVDGVPAQALWTNYLFRGVLVPPGSHQVVWRYHCPGLFLGAIVSSATLLVLLGGAVVPAAWIARRPVVRL